MENDDMKSTVFERKSWFRILYMLLFAIVLYLVMMLVGLIAVVQIVFSLFSGKPNLDLLEFSDDLSRYVQQIVAFLMYVDDRRPFPFNDVDEDDVDDMQNVDSIGDAPSASDDENRSR